MSEEGQTPKWLARKPHRWPRRLRWARALGIQILLAKVTTKNSLEASLHHRLTMTMGYQKRALAVLVAVLCILPLASASPVSLLRLFVS